MALSRTGPAGSNPFLLGDPDKKQQNEPSCDISPNNPLIVFCGMNSYSAVDRPDISGEPWVGAAFTMDGGLTWKSHLHPGFQPKPPAPGAPAPPAPLAPPLGYETAADPVVRLVPGMGLFTFIAFNRDGNGALLMGRWFERTIESGFPYRVEGYGPDRKRDSIAPPSGHRSVCRQTRHEGVPAVRDGHLRLPGSRPDARGAESDAHSESAGWNRSRVVRGVYREHRAGGHEDQLHEVH